MHSEDLLVFLSVATNGNLSRASIEIGLSQPALSRRIALLESQLGTRLFYRSGRGLVLTESGQRLISYAQTIKSTLDEATASLSAPSHRGPTSIVLAAPPTIARILFASVAKALQEQYPGIKIRFKEGLGAHIQDWIANGDIDAAVVYLPDNHAALGVDIVLRERLCLIAPMNFAPLGNSFPVDRLAEVPMVLPSHPHMLRVLSESLVKQSGKTLNIVMECDASINITKQLVIDNGVCTVLPLAAVREDLRDGRLQVAPLSDPAVVRDIGIISSRNRPPMASQWEVLRTIRHEMTRLVAEGAWPDAFLP